MVDIKKAQKKLYDDATYYHLIHNGKKIIKNQFGMFWRRD
jgi:hypothetical protein